MTNEKSYNGLDLMRLIMAVLVIGSHTGLLANCTNSYISLPGNNLLQASVFYFFLCAGFFLRKKAEDVHSEKSRQAVRSYLIKTVKLYAIWSAIYAPLAAVYYATSGVSVAKALVLYLCGFFLVGQNYNSWMLWYLLSCVYALVFVLALLKRRVSLERITLYGGVVYLLGLLLTEFIQYGGSLPPLVEMVRQLLSKTINSGRIFSGFFFLPVGMLLAEKPQSLKTGILLFLCGFVGDILFEDTVGSVFRGITAIGIFVTASEIHLKSAPLYPMLRRMSNILYFIHMYVWTFYYTLVYGQKTYGPDSFLATTLISLLLAYLYIAFSRWKRSRR